MGFFNPLNPNREKVEKAAMEAKRVEEAEAEAKDRVLTSNPQP